MCIGFLKVYLLYSNKYYQTTNDYDSFSFYIIRKEKNAYTKNLHCFFLLLSVKANRNDTYLFFFFFFLSPFASRSSLFGFVLWLAFFFMKSQRRANIEKRAQPVKSRVNKAREITKTSLNIYTNQHTGSYSFFLSLSLMFFFNSLNYL